MGRKVVLPNGVVRPADSYAAQIKNLNVYLGVEEEECIDEDSRKAVEKARLDQERHVYKIAENGDIVLKEVTTRRELLEREDKIS